MLQKSSQYIRPYKIEIYGLQDNFIGTLQSYNDISIGRLNEPILEISTDGTQSFTGSIPKYYIDKTNNQRKLNPRWADTENGVLAENTRILKVFIKHDNDIRVFPLIIDSITTKRDKNFSVYREITASGLAFAELGKLGYKLELTSHTLETDYEEDSSTVATINYWLDKVFPNEKDADGKIINWLTPWCYEIRMDWETVTGENLVSDKIYDTPHINSWGLTSDGKALTPLGITGYQEKARYIDCKDSNKYNITQTLAETFEVFCTYEYKCAENGTFIRNYIDEKGNYWTGRKVVFYNRAINMDNPLTVNYQKNLDSVSRTVDSSEIYTKMYVRPIESTIMSAGQIDISNTPLNPLQEDFILDFDYLYSIGGITQEQNDFIESYKAQLHAINTSLTQKYDQQIVYENELEKLEADIEFYNKAITSAQNNLTTYQPLRDNEQTGTVTVGGEDGTTPVNIYFAENSTLQRYEGTLRHTGIDVSTILGYTSQADAKKDGTDEESEDSPINPAFNNVLIYNNDKLSENIDKFFFLSSNNGAQNKLITSLNNPLISGDDGVKSFWLTYTYNPRDYYEDICNMYNNILNQYNTKKSNAETAKTTKEATLSVLEIEIKILETEKIELNKALENRLGPALREGYWAPDSYEDPGQSCKENVSIDHDGVNIEKAASMYFDTEPLENEEKGWYIEDVEGIPTESKTFYPYCLIPKTTYQAWAQNLNNILDLTIHLQQKVTTEVGPENFKIAANTSKYYQAMFNGEYRYFIINNNTNTEVTYKSMTLEENGANLNLTFTSTANKKLSIVWKTKTDIGSNPTTLLTLPFSNSVYLYNNAGFIFGFVQTSNNSSDKVFKPALIFNDRTINESFASLNLAHLAYSFANVTGVTVLANKTSLDTPKLSEVNCLGYPRIRINQDNVMYESDTLKITPFISSTSNDVVYSEGVYSSLVEFDEYMTTVDNGWPVFTLKLSKDQSFEKILNWPYHVDYKISRANEMLYRDALIVAHDSSRPKYSYELTVANLPENTNNVQLGQLVLINDFSVGIRSETGYISSIKFDLDNPQNDDITIQDYTTKFEDLFTTITATNEAMKQNQSLYNTIATNFTSGGQISGNVLQSVFNNNNIAFNYSATQVEISPTEGIILTNLTPYDNGVYGQVVLKGGGVFLSSSIDAEGNRIWSNAITPMGINASSIATGVLDTSRIRVYAGDDLAFQWNADGIFAYKKSDTGTLLTDAYVKYSNEGLQFILEEAGNVNNCSVYLGWEGLKLSAQSGALTLTAQDGLQIFYPEHNGMSEPALQVGRWKPDNSNVSYYGLRMFNTSGQTTFTVDNNGNLSLVGTMQSHPFTPGFAGQGWRILRSGDAEFNNVYIRGTISASVFEYEEVSAVGGQVYIAPTLIANAVKQEKTTPQMYYSDIDGIKLEGTNVPGANGAHIAFKLNFGFTKKEGKGYHKCGRIWKSDDVVTITCSFKDANNNAYEIKNGIARFVELKDTNGYSTLVTTGIIYTPDETNGSTVSTQNFFYNEEGPVEAGTVDLSAVTIVGEVNCIYFGSYNDEVENSDVPLLNRKGLLLTAMADSGPYIDVWDDLNGLNVTAGTVTPPKARLGCLDDLGTITWLDKYNTQLTITPGGYGLYSDNVYLTGAIYATSGKIGSLSIDEVVQANSDLSITLISNTSFTYTDQTEDIDIGFKLYSGNKRINKKSDLPIILSENTYTVKYQYYNGTNWQDFQAYTTAKSLFDANGNIVETSYVFQNEPTSEKYRVVIYSTSTSGEKTSFYSDIAKYNYVQNGPQGDTGPQGETGPTGDAAWSYYLNSNFDNITVDIDGMVPSNNTNIIIKVTRAQGSQAPEIYPNLTANNFRVQLVSSGSDTATTIPSGSSATTTTYKLDVAKGTISFKPQLKAANTTQYRFYEITLYHAGEQVKTLSIPYVLSSRLAELGKVREGEVVIDNGKIYAEALTTGSVISGKVSAGAIQTGAIAANSTLYLLSSGTTSAKKFNMPPEFTIYNESTDTSGFPDWQPYSGATTLSWNNALAYATALSDGFQSIWDTNHYQSGIKIGSDGIFMRGSAIELTGGKILLQDQSDAPNYKLELTNSSFIIESTNTHFSMNGTDGLNIIAIKSNTERTRFNIQGSSLKIQSNEPNNPTTYNNALVELTPNTIRAQYIEADNLSVKSKQLLYFDSTASSVAVDKVIISSTQPTGTNILWGKLSSPSTGNASLSYSGTGSDYIDNQPSYILKSASSLNKNSTYSTITYKLSFSVVFNIYDGHATANNTYSFGIKCELTGTAKDGSEKTITLNYNRNNPNHYVSNLKQWGRHDFSYTDNIDLSNDELANICYGKTITIKIIPQDIRATGNTSNHLYNVNVVAAQPITLICSAASSATTGNYSVSWEYIP